MNLSYSVLLELLQQLENSKRINVVNNFGNRYIEIFENDTQTLLDNYYNKVGGEELVLFRFNHTRGRI